MEADNIPEEVQNVEEVVNPDINTPDSILEERIKAAKALASQFTSHVETTTPNLISTDEVRFVQPVDKKKKQTKPQLIESILKLQEKLDEQKPKSHFDRMNKPELEEYLMWLTNKGVNKHQGTNVPMKKGNKEDEDVEDVENNEKAEKLKSKDLKYGAQALFRVNLIFAKVAELTSINFREQIGTDLEGFTSDLQEKETREQLEEILAQIFEENSELIQEYISPFNQYILLMLGLASNRAYTNRKKVEEEFQKKT